MNLKLFADDMVYLIWCVFFIIAYALVTGAAASYNTAKFITYIYKGEMRNKD
jgi:hypothetical protein